MTICLLVWADAGLARASPLDFLFGEPPLESRPAYRLRRRPTPPLTRRQPPQAEAEVPLPVPRPHFPGDPPAVAGQAERSMPPGPGEAAARPPAPPPEPAEPSAPASDTGAPAPLPPPKPADLDKPAAPASEAQVPGGTKPEPAKPESAKPDPAKPDPAELAKSKAPKPEPPEAKPAAPRPAGPAASDAAKGAPPAAAPTPLPAQPPTPPPKPPEVAGPTVTTPSVAPSGATTAFTPRSPQDDPQCPARLQGLKVDVAPTTIGPQPDDRCTVVQPVKLSGVTLADGRTVAFPEHPTIACTTADAFSSYVRDLLVPLAKGTFSAPVAAVWTGPGLECRSRDHVFGAKLSAHGQGLAIDIAQLKLGDGRLVEVGTPKTDAETAFETAARAGACGYFHTVLGPGSDAYHRTHWHFDLEVRGKQGDSKYCK